MIIWTPVVSTTRSHRVAQMRLQVSRGKRMHGRSFSMVKEAERTSEYNNTSTTLSAVALMRGVLHQGKARGRSRDYDPAPQSFVYRPKRQTNP